MTRDEHVQRLELERLRPTPPRPYTPPAAPVIPPDVAAADHRRALAAVVGPAYDRRMALRRARALRWQRSRSATAARASSEPLTAREPAARPTTPTTRREAASEPHTRPVATTDARAITGTTGA